MMTDVRLVIAEDQSLFREELAYTLGAPQCRAKVLMLTSEEQHNVVAAFDAGARRYVTKSIRYADLATNPSWLRLTPLRSR